MGIEIAVIGGLSENKAQLWVTASDNEWTSVITVQGHQRVNVGIVVGSQISDILSLAVVSAAISGITSFFSGVITLQRRMPEETEDFHWRDVSNWTISSASLTDTGGSENITAYPEPETCQYRVGTNKEAGAFVAGNAVVRIGTS